MELSLSAAAKATGKAKATIHRAVKSGKLSARRDEAGTYHIDPSELARVFPLNVSETAQRDATPPLPEMAEPLATEVAVLRTKVEMLTALLDREREATAELRQVIAMLPKVVRSEPQGVSRVRGLLSRFLSR